MPSTDKVALQEGVLSNIIDAVKYLDVLSANF